MYIQVKCILELAEDESVIREPGGTSEGGDKMTDEKILALLRADDEKGLTAAMSRYSRLVASVAAGMLSSKEDIEEVASDTFYKVWNSRQSIDTEKGSLKNYICMIARSCTLNKLRTLSVTEPLPDDERDLGIEVDFTHESAAEHNRKIIAECIRSLPSPDREIFIERFYYSLSLTEIARRNGVTVRRVEYIIHRSKSRLRGALMKGGILL